MHDIGPRCTKIKQGANHGTVYLLVRGLAFGVEVKISIWLHGCLHHLDVLHPGALEHILGVLGSGDEDTFFNLLDLKSEKVLQLPHHGHLEFTRHKITKFLAKTPVR